MLAIEGVLGLVLLAACTALVVRTIHRSSPAAALPHVAILAANGHAGATLRIISGTPALIIGVADLGLTGTLLRVSTPAASTAPVLRTAGGAGNPVVSLSSAKASAITVTLNSAVSWQLDLAAGTTRTIANLAGGRLAGIAVTKGSDVIDLTLPRPAASVTVRLAAGASRLQIDLPSGVPARVSTTAGAGEIALNGQSHVGVAAGSVYSTPGWAPGAAGYDIDATVGAARITVTTQAG
jgi:hypothetical protein